MFYNDDNSDMPSTKHIPFVLMELYLNNKSCTFHGLLVALVQIFLEKWSYLGGVVRPN